MRANGPHTPEDPPGEETWHLDAELCRRFIDTRISPPERRAVIRHLISQCPKCLGLLRRIVGEAYEEGEYAAAFQAGLKFASGAARRKAFERLRGWACWSALVPLQPGQRLEEIITHKDWHHWGLFRALLDAAHSVRDPSEGADLAQLALDIADLLSPIGVGGEAAAHDMRARASVVIADNRLLAGDLEGARSAIAQAWRWHDGGAGDRLDKARIYVCDAAYTAAIGETEASLTILRKALTIYEAADDPNLQGRTLIQMGTTIGPVSFDTAIRYVQRGLDLLNAVREPRLHLCGQHLLAELLCAAERADEALAVMDRLRSQYSQFPDDGIQLRLHWLLGRIMYANGHFAEATYTLQQAQQEFRARDMRRDFLSVTIDLAEAYAAAGEVATSLRVLSEETQLLTRWGLHNHAMSAWLLLQETLAERQGLRLPVTDLLRQARLYYRRYWHVTTAQFSLTTKPNVHRP